MAALLDGVLKAQRRSADCNVCSVVGKKSLNELIYAFKMSRNLKRDYSSLHNVWLYNTEIIQSVDKEEKISDLNML